jgi:hypothetical protein
MKIYKVKMMSGQEIVLEGREALDALTAATNQGARLVITKYGAINPASIDSITPHKEIMSNIAEEMRFGHTLEEATKTVLGEPSFGEEIKKLN